MTEIILTLTVSIISMGVLVWVAILSNKFFKYFKEIAQEIIDEQKKNK
jgi:F0F1-type ATP synthase membrane subunit a